MTATEFEKIRIPVVEIFQSISGEGISAGSLVTFVRVAGCDLRCSWCDTKYSFNESGSGVRSLLPSEIVNEVKNFGSPELICTGGEPLEEGKAKRYLPLFLARNNFGIRIETSGGSFLYSTDELSEFAVKRSEIAYCMDIKCPGSHMEHKNRYENIPLLASGDELKFVVANQEDLKFSLGVIKEYNRHLSANRIALNFSPVFGAIQPVSIVDFMKENREYFDGNNLWTRLSLQLHKFVWPPHQRGV
jgi:7-carboxy-7-deazaguanine synthase